MKLYKQTKQAILEALKDDYNAYNKVSAILEASEQAQQEAQDEIEAEYKQKEEQEAKGNLKHIANKKRIVKR